MSFPIPKTWVPPKWLTGAVVRISPLTPAEIATQVKRLLARDGG